MADEQGHQVITSYPGGAVLCHERLSIIDLHTGKQPIRGSRSNYVIHNGEIYNHQQLRSTLTKGEKLRTTSDSEIIIHLWEEKGTECIHDLDGVFAFVLVDGDKVFAGRDPIGVKPLTGGKSSTGVIWFASEQKSLIEVCEEVRSFPRATTFIVMKAL